MLPTETTWAWATNRFTQYGLTNRRRRGKFEVSKQSCAQRPVPLPADPTRPIVVDHADDATFTETVDRTIRCETGYVGVMSSLQPAVLVPFCNVNERSMMSDKRGSRPDSEASASAVNLPGVAAADDIESGTRDARQPDSGAAAATRSSSEPTVTDAVPQSSRNRPTRSTSARRGFLTAVLGSPLVVGFTAFVGAIGIWLLGLARFMFPNIVVEPPTKFKVGFPADYPIGRVETKYKAQHGVWIVHDQYLGDMQIYALQAICTHLGCIPYWLETEKKFKCPCHGSGFYEDGINFEGPAPRPLERYAIRVAEDGQLEVDKSRTFQQELGQWSHPDCFVRV